MGHIDHIIDADAHVNPPATFWDQYLPSNMKDRGPQIEVGSEKDGHDWVLFEGTRKPLVILTSVAGLGREHKMMGRAADVHEGGFLPAARLKDMDKDGIGSAVLFGGGPLGAKDNDLFIESFRAYNRWLADFISYDRKRLVGVAYLPMQDVGEAVAMLKEAAKQGMSAVNIPAFPMSGKAEVGGGFAAQLLALTGDPHGERQYDSPEFDPFWKAAIDHNMAITIHLGARVARPGMTRLLPHMVMSKVSMGEPIAIMVFGGVFDRFPDLRFGSIESGVGWFAWMGEYMDNIYAGHHGTVELKHQPSYYLDKNVWGSFIRDKVGIQQRHLKGGHNIMWSSDYPHSETSWPDSMGSIARQFDGLTDEERYPILIGNAKTFYNL